MRTRYICAVEGYFILSLLGGVRGSATSVDGVVSAPVGDLEKTRYCGKVQGL